jgi:hypothetical protein
MDYPSSLEKCNNFSKSYGLSTSCQCYDLHDLITMFMPKEKTIVSMEKINVVLRLMQYENQSFSNLLHIFKLKHSSIGITRVCSYNTTPSKRNMNQSH